MVSAVDVTLIVGIGRAYGAPLPSDWTAVLAALVLGGGCFCALGVAVASLIRNAEAAPAVVQFVLFPLLFLSGTYLPIHAALLNRIAGVLPVRPFNQLMIGAFAPHATLRLADLAVLLAWGLAGAIVGIRRFRWNPRPECHRPRGSARGSAVSRALRSTRAACEARSAPGRRFSVTCTTDSSKMSSC